MSDNELIAEFHGWTHVPTPKGKGKGIWNFTAWNKAAFNSECFLYHKSWDWLMPVVEKIESLMPDIKIPEDLDALKNGTHGSEEHIEVISLSIASKIGDVYTAVVKFIKWYNENEVKDHERE